MPGRGLDPDAFLREQVFQPIVDRWDMDPRRTALALLRIHIVGMMGGGTSATAIAQARATAGGSPWWLPSLMLLVFAMAVLQVWLQVRRPPHACMTPHAAVLRITWMGVLAVEIHGAVSLSDAAGGASTAAVVAWAVVLAWTAGVCAAYLNTCRKPPPRPPRRTRTAGAKWATAN